VPGSEAPVLPIDLPSGLTGAARERVAERQLVEALSLPPARFEMHPFATKGEKVWTRTVLVDPAKAEGWRKDLGRAVGVLPDYLGLPAAPGLWAIEQQGARVIARLGPADGFSAEMDLALAQLRQAPPPKAILRLGPLDAALEQMLQALQVPVLSDLKGLKKVGLVPLKWADSIGGLDLGAPPSAAVDRIRAGLRRWRLGALAASVAAAAWLGMLWTQTHQASDAAELANSRIETLVRAHFVPAGPILDVRAQVSAALETALEPDVIEQTGVAPLAQLQIAAETLTRDGARVLSALYLPGSGLETAVATDTFAVLDEIVIGLLDADFLVEQLESRSEQAGGVVSRLRLELFE
jgi:general secretion pathway protein L